MKSFSLLVVLLKIGMNVEGTDFHSCLLVYPLDGGGPALTRGEVQGTMNVLRHNVSEHLQDIERLTFVYQAGGTPRCRSTSSIREVWNWCGSQPAFLLPVISVSLLAGFLLGCSFVVIYSSYLNGSSTRSIFRSKKQLGPSWVFKTNELGFSNTVVHIDVDGDSRPASILEALPVVDSLPPPPPLASYPPSPATSLPPPPDSSDEETLIKGKIPNGIIYKVDKNTIQTIADIEERTRSFSQSVPIPTPRETLNRKVPPPVRKSSLTTIPPPPKETMVQKEASQESETAATVPVQTNIQPREIVSSKETDSEEKDECSSSAANFGSETSERMRNNNTDIPQVIITSPSNPPSEASSADFNH